jgi:serine/threonine-protein kinase
MKKQSKMTRDYHLCEEIGKGRTGTVYRAVHKPSSKTVALKMLSPDYLAKKSILTSWNSEATFHCPLKHDNIIRCYDFFVEGDQAYLVTEYVDGFNLSQCIAHCSDCLEGGKPQFSHFMDTALKICRGLIYLHDKKIVHGHVKPENILVSREVAGPSRNHKQVKISDFGMAGSMKGFFRPSVHVKGGTPKYMAPEQTTRKKATYRSDIFSFGVTLYELFTGRHPWSGATGKKELLAKMLSPRHRPVPPSQLVESLPRQLDTVIMDMLENDEKKRPSTMAEVWLGLNNVETPRI